MHRWWVSVSVFSWFCVFFPPQAIMILNVIPFPNDTDNNHYNLSFDFQDIFTLIYSYCCIRGRYRNNATSKPCKVFTGNLISQWSPNSSLPEKPLSSNFAYEQPSDAQALNGMLCLLWWVGQPIHLRDCAQSRRVGNRCSRHWAPGGDG